MIENQVFGFQEKVTVRVRIKVRVRVRVTALSTRVRGRKDPKWLGFVVGRILSLH